MERTPTHIPLTLVFTALFIAGFVTVLYLTDPYTGGSVAHLLFHLALFLSVTGVATAAGQALRLRTGSRQPNYGISLRQGIFLAIFLTGSLLLLSHGILYWWVELTLILFLIFLELFLNL